MNWKRALIAATAAIPLILLLAWGFSRNPGDIPSPLPGKPAPLFALGVFAPGQPPLERKVGDTLRLEDFRGKVVVLNFWASWCLACREEHVALSDAARRYTGKPVQFLGVLFNDRAPPAIDWISEMGGQSYPSVMDPGAHVAVDFGLYGVPETFFIDVTGRVARKQIGPASDVVLNHVIDSLLAAGAQTPVAAR
ncbi:MAG TPA: redoxin family protein [Gemmatimonadaceae bacterium]|nr:redoxin family protein [Gemmatimonadaceae bacterium]